MLDFVYYLICKYSLSYNLNIMKRIERRITVEPIELILDGLEVGRVHVEEMVLTNTMSVSVEIELKPGPTIDRQYEIIPSYLRFGPKESARIEVRSKLLRPIKSGWIIRDAVHILSDNFDETFYISIRDEQYDKPLSRAIPQRIIEEPDREKERLEEIFEDKKQELFSANHKIETMEDEIEKLSEELKYAYRIIDDKEKVEQEMSILREENIELKQALDECRMNESYSEKVVELFRDKAPSLETLVELTLQQERERNEANARKTLEILNIKDGTIQDLQRIIGDQRHQIAGLQHQMEDTKVLLNNAEKSLKSAHQTIDELKTYNFDKDILSQSLKNELDKLNDKFHKTIKGTEVLEMSDTITQLQRELENDKREAEANMKKINELTNKLRKCDEEANKLKLREQYVLELSERQGSIREESEKMIREKDQIITELRAKVSTQTEHIDSLLGKFSQSSYHDVLSKVLQLEEENKNLSRQLAESQRSSISFKQEELDGSLEGGHDKKIQVLETENLKLTDMLKESKDH